MVKLMGKKRTKVPEKQTFNQHLLELRSRILVSLLSLSIGSTVGYYFRNQILTLLVKPLNQPIFYVSPAGGFTFVFRISLFFGLLVSLPVFIYETLLFIEPALPKIAPKFVIKILLVSLVLLLLGIGFAYFISLPIALYFLNSFANSQIKALISTTEYFTFVTRYLLGLGIIFQLPLLIYCINIFHKITVKQLLRYQKYVLVISVVIAAILTPTPDVINQVIMALPLFFLYEATIMVIWFTNKYHR